MVGAAVLRETVTGIEAALAAGLYVTTNTTLTKENAPIFRTFFASASSWA